MASSSRSSTRTWALAALLATGCGAGGDVAASSSHGDAAPPDEGVGGVPADAAAPRAEGGAGLGGSDTGFPGDFPRLVDVGGSGKGEAIRGFGGDTTTDRSGNRAALRRRPVVLLHGNGVNTFDARFGMGALRDMLRGEGYAPAEIWAPSYLGQSITSAEIPTPIRNNVDDVRSFVEAVLEYLAVDRVDLVGHSLGCSMINAYLRGLRSDGTFDPATRRFDRAGTVVCLGGGPYGTGYGPLYDPELNVAGEWAREAVSLDGIEDATPFGARSIAEMKGPNTTGTLPAGRPFHEVTAHDNGPHRIHWVALWANGDVVDATLKNGGGLGGADLNHGFDLPSTMPGTHTPLLAKHAHLTQSRDVFAAMLPYLDR